jgi:hypothetical protein
MSTVRGPSALSKNMMTQKKAEREHAFYVKFYGTEKEVILVTQK